MKRLLVLSLSVCALRGGAVPAFPGAEGFGANAAGGRGGTVYHVTNLNDSGPGSLRTGVSGSHRTIVFDVSGTIALASDLKIHSSNLTIAGQTAPGDGIALLGRLTSVQNTHDVIVRYLRCRPGDTNCPTFQDDAFHFVNATNCIADHLSASWSIDESLSCTWSTNLTVQWCIIGASLNCSCHVKGCHGYGTLLRYGAGRESFHHNLYAHNQSRNPRLGDNHHLDFVNNVIYDWGGTAGYNAEDSGNNPNGYTNALNYVNNYLLAGPSTSGRLSTAFASGVASATQCEIYQSGNLIDNNLNGVLDGLNTGWSMFSGLYTREASPFAAPAVTTDAAPVAYERVLAFVGDSVARDAVDQQIVGNVRNQNGHIINSQIEEGGWPTLNATAAPLDTDQDGVPDYWEQALGWNPAVANNNHTNADGYTDLEWYLNWLAAPHAVSDRNGEVDVNLQQVTGGSPGLTYTVANGTNGTVSLLSDGHTARFVPTNNFSGLADFRFHANDPATGNGFGPVSVDVLVTTTNAPVVNMPPMLSAIPDYDLIAGAMLTFTNQATDTDQPAQTLTFALLNAPPGAALGPNDGVFTWRPTIAQGGTTNRMSVVVTDDGSPNLSATQTFNVAVTEPMAPAMQSFASATSKFNLLVNGDVGPDYLVQASTNLATPNWVTLFTTNPSSLPFAWSDDGSINLGQRYYRIRLGP